MGSIAPTQASEGVGPFVYEVAHRITYTTTRPVPISEVIGALQGLESLLKSVPLVASALTKVEVDSAQFFIQHLSTGSLIEDIVIKFFFKDRATLDAWVEKLGEKPGMRALVIAAMLGGLVLYGLKAVVADKPSPVINATNSIIIERGAMVLNVSPEAFQAAIAAVAAPDKKKVAESALRLTAPVRADSGASVQFGPPDQEPTSMLGIPFAAVSEAPSRLDLGRNERTEIYENTLLAIRAADLDSKKHGWAGRLGTREERLPIELAPNVSEVEMFGRESVRVDATLVFQERGKSHELKPARIYVSRVYPSH